MHTITLELAVQLVSDYAKLGSYDLVARRHGVDRRTVKRWCDIKQEYGTVAIKFAVNKKPAMSPQAAKLAVDLLTGRKHGNSTGVASELHKRGLTKRVLHRTTVARHAKQAAKASGRGIMVERGATKKLLGQVNVAKRLAFAGANKARDWGDTMITDRKRFHFHHPGERVDHVRWAYRDSPTAAFTVNHPKCVNMYAGLTKYGVTKPILVTGTTGLKTKYKNKKGEASKNITQAEYRDVLLEGLLPEGNRIFSAQGLSSWVLQQDGDPAHRGVAEGVLPTHNRQRSTKVQLLKGWPANSPDLSPIENLWAIVDRRVQAAGCTNFEEFKETVEREWLNVSPQLCKKLMGSMSNRLQECSQGGGKRTKY